NLAVCPPYNADFDGDEMNLHVLQSEEARAEARVLMRVQEHILSPRFGGPVIGGIHDHITGSFLLTYKESKFTREEVTFILSKIDENGVGAFKGKILDKLARDYGPDAARVFIDKGTKMAIGAIMIRGFTTGIDDEDIPEEAKKQISDSLRTAIEKVEGLVDSYKRGELEQMPGRSLEETLEVEAMKILGRARDLAGQI